jgi:hypothetical protein
MENQQFLKRLQNQKSCYSVSRWEEDFSKKEKLMREVMCEYPFVLDKTPGINNTYQDQPLNSHRQSLNSAGGLKEFLDYRSSHEGGIANLNLLPNGGNSSTNVRMQSARNFRTNLETSQNRV